MPITAKITAVGGYVPEYVLTNQELETMVETNDQWIRERTGIIERRILKGERGSSVMAIEAFKAMQQVYPNVDAGEIDLIVCATVTPDMQFPATANKIGLEIGAKKAFGFDLEAACSSFLYALSVGAQFIETGRLKKVLVVGVDKMSSIIDYTDRQTCIIFGDGAGCVLLEPDEDGYGLLDGVYYSDGEGIKHLHQKAGGSIKPATEDTVRAKEHFVYQEGRPVFKQAVVKMAEAGEEIMQRNNLKDSDIAWLVPHQANKRIIDATRERMGLPEEKVMLNIQRYGNTTSGTLPLCLWDYREQLNKGDKLVFATFGGGFTWGASLLKWAL
ncbi:MAG: beta-ketoacyl-ACP synthase III [Bacteroidota bacterium]